MCVCACVCAEPPLPTSNPPKKRPKMAKTQSLSIELSEIMEDEYIPMEPIYTEPPPESAERQDSTARESKGGLLLLLLLEL